MRENFEMRRDLVNILSNKTGENLSGQIAGYTAKDWLPKGLIAKVAAGSEAYVMRNLNPVYWPLLATSSPRLVGEFLNAFGKGLSEVSPSAPALYKSLAFGAGKASENKAFSMKDVAKIDTPSGKIDPNQLKDFMFGKPQPISHPSPKQEPEPQPKEDKNPKKKYTRKDRRNSNETE
jgi:hypothetical protein